MHPSAYGHALPYWKHCDVPLPELTQTLVPRTVIECNSGMPLSGKTAVARLGGIVIQPDR